MVIKHPCLIIKQHGPSKSYRYVEDVSLTARSGLQNSSAPTWRAKDVGENDTYETTWIPSTVWQGRGVEQRADLMINTTYFYPGSGH